MTPDEIESLFTGSDGSFHAARWGRPIAPVVFGVEDETIVVLRSVLQGLCDLTGLELAEVDPELGVNLMVFFCREWRELAEVPNLEALLPDLSGLVGRLRAAKANQFRTFRYDDEGAIQAAFVFLRMDQVLSDMPADVLATTQMVQIMATWAEGAFRETGLIPEVAELLRALYDPVLPAVATDPSHALRIFARMEKI